MINALLLSLALAGAPTLQSLYLGDVLSRPCNQFQSCSLKSVNIFGSVGTLFCANTPLNGTSLSLQVASGASLQWVNSSCSSYAAKLLSDASGNANFQLASLSFSTVGTNDGAAIGIMGSLRLTTKTNLSTLTAPANAVNYTQQDADLDKLWQSDGTNWRDMQSGAHPTLDAMMMSARVGPERSDCPTISQTIPTSGGATTTYACVDGAAASLGTGAQRFYRNSNTSGVINNISTVTTGTFFEAFQKPRWCQWVLTPATITNIRLWAGASAADPTSVAGDTPITAGYMFRFSTSAGDSNWRICSGDSATGSCTDTTAAVSASTEYLLCVDNRGSSVIASVHAPVGPVYKSIIKTGNLPTGQPLKAVFSVENLSAATHAFGWGPISVEYK